MTPKESAKHFCENEKQFHLGFLPTEQAHPATRRLSEVCQTDLAAGIRMLGTVDRDIPPAARAVFASEPFARLVRACIDAVRGDGRIVFSGCGATGRLAILLENMWRNACRARPETAALETRAASIFTGGDYALVRSVESFEDYLSFGRRQVEELNLGPQDTLIAVSEGGETSSVIGTALEAAERGARVFFAFNNPADLLSRHIERSRTALTHPDITPLDLCTGPMAVAGSTRMQATTMECLVLGHALERVYAHLRGTVVETDPVEAFERLLDELDHEPAVQAIAALAEMEAETYRRHGRITYFAHRLMLDIFTDTTERAPTFMLPPFVKADDPVSPPSWAFVKNPLFPTEAAWLDVFGREPNCLEWTRDDYARMGASKKIQENPPAIGRKELFKFRIGNERDETRFAVAPAAAIAVISRSDRDPEGGAFDDAFQRLKADFSQSLYFGIGVTPHAPDSLDVPIRIPDSDLRLWERIAVKLVMNTVSTATMARLGRIQGNGMVWVEATNKKLVDRATRLISELSGLPYPDACCELFQSMAELETPAWEGREKPSPVQLALKRIRS